MRGLELRFVLAALGAFALSALASSAWAQAQVIEVTLQGTFGNRAVLALDGGAPLTMTVGTSAQGVKLIAVSADTAVIEAQGKRRTIAFGLNAINVSTPTKQAPDAASDAAPLAATSTAGAIAKQDERIAGNGRAALQADGRGHFTAQGAINGVPSSMMVDTGATLVVIPAPEARRLGIDYQRLGTPGAASTANGTVRLWRVKLDSIKVQGVVAYGVDAAVQEAPLQTILLGNSFLSRVQLQRDGDQMVLTQRY